MKKILFWTYLSFKELGKRWAEFGPTFKQKYEAKAEKDRERYVNAKQDFQQMLKDEKNGMDIFWLLMVITSIIDTIGLTNLSNLWSDIVPRVFAIIQSTFFRLD